MGKKEYIIFVLARIGVTAIKPLMLGWMLWMGMQEEANLISLLFLVVASTMVLLNNESYFYFYKELFKGDNNNIRIVKEESNYYKSFISHAVIFLIIVFGIVFFMTQSVYLSIPFFIILFLEKLFDEIQRFLQFKKLFLKWSFLNIVKSVIPFVIGLVVYYVSKKNIFFVYTYIITLILILSFINLKFLGIKKIKYFYRVLKQIKLNDLQNYLKYYQKKLFLNQLQSFTTANLLVFDRTLVRFFRETELAQISLLAQLCSVAILFVDFFLISHRRDEYLKKKAKVFEIVSLSKLMFTFLLLFVCGNIMFYFMSDFLQNKGLTLTVALVGVVIFSYSLMAISSHFVNFNFWNRKRKFTLSIDVLFFLLSFIIFMVLGKEKLSSILYAIAFALTLRFFFLIVLAKIQSHQYKL